MRINEFVPRNLESSDIIFLSSRLSTQHDILIIQVNHLSENFKDTYQTDFEHS